MFVPFVCPMGIAICNIWPLKRVSPMSKSLISTPAWPWMRLTPYIMPVLLSNGVRVCGEIEWAGTKGVMGRGINSRIIHDLNEDWGNSLTCTSCGKCVEVCPTGALVSKGKSAGEMEKRRDWLPYLRLIARSNNE